MTTCQARKRKLYDWEIEEARIVFGDKLRYERVRVHECATWPDTLDRFGRWLKRMPPLEAHQHNAITLGNHCHFPVQLPESPAPPGEPMPTMGWLIHELTHVWQYQIMGWSYVVKALAAQFREGANVYRFGGAGSPSAKRGEGWTFRRFNLEQQGAITQEFYNRRRGGEDVSEWMPYIKSIQKE